MSDLETKPQVRACGGTTDIKATPVRDLITGRNVPLGESTEVRRLLPTLGRRMIGAWCFIDHYGPDDIASEPGMQVPPHPHTGLQTVSWLKEGEILHRDSLGNRQTIHPGQLGLMTSGHAISHAEQSPVKHPRLLHGAQLWVALPDNARHREPAWEFYKDLPTVTARGMSASVILGTLDGTRSPGTTYSPLVGATIAFDSGITHYLPLEPDFEYAALAMTGALTVDGVKVEPGALLYLGCGRNELRCEATDGAAEIMLLGGEPFEEKLVMWWNFIGRSHDEINEARTAWENSDRFGEVDFEGQRLTAPPMPPTTLKPRGRER